MHPHSFGRRAVVPLRFLAPLALAACAAAPMLAQATNPCTDAPSNRAACVDYRFTHSVTRTIYLDNTTSQNDANEVLVALRNLLDPSTKLYLVANRNAIVIRTTPEDIEAAQRIINDLTHPRKSFRVVFTLNTFDGTHKLSSQHVSVDALVGQRTMLKQGSKVPLSTGSTKSGQENTTQFTYIDVGTNLDVTLTDTGKGLLMKSKIEESTVAEEKPIGSVVEPIIHQAVIEGVTSLTPGKPTDLGSVDISGTTQHLTIEAIAEPQS